MEWPRFALKLGLAGTVCGILGKTKTFFEATREHTRAQECAKKHFQLSRTPVVEHFIGAGGKNDGKLAKIGGKEQENWDLRARQGRDRVD